MDEKPPNGYHGPGATDKEANDIQARLPVARNTKRHVRSVETKREAKWAIEKPKLDTAEKLRGIHFIDPAEKESKEAVKNARRKLEVLMPAAMPCKTTGRGYRETCSAPGICKRKYACIVEADEFSRKRMEGTPHKDHEDHIAGKGINSLYLSNIVHKISYVSSNENTRSTSSSGKRMGNT